ncbi:hypothetical protein PFICI_13568 [Pestalotiopsis fici W106-1]|uniref:NACHT domain-containing protein n=1 Tax=Pestalotiopsis fici (strain W106-1 / CGMCC3.15140) TaxID=1229662 RepID=W3WMT5_PESFW|nr:uncharacterized protein PFICI_13568 [Pestalotiopsis fici W106-1]ETS75084.1 hypothetical protein PFICI_13568 [Pestalotiopsis fici W106-1]
MSVADTQPTSGDNLSVEAALDSLFDKILESLKQIDIFSSSNQPIVFPVYAHDNPVAGTSHAWCVIQIIKWLEAAGCRVISDRTPLLPRHGLGDENENAAIRNILSSQLRLLPRNDDRENTYEPTYANKVIVFSSEVLRQYCVNAAAEQYVQSVAKAYRDSQGQPRDHLKSNIRAMVEENARNGSAWFHHVLTEIAFMRIRKDHDCLDHGIIPVALDGDLPDYLPFVNPTDLVLKQEINSLYSSDLHQLFFKIILQIYPKQHLPIEKFKECYMALKARLIGGDESVIRNLSDAEVVKFIRQVYESILQQDRIATRQRLRDADSHRGIEQNAKLSRKRAFLSKLATVPYRDRKDRNPKRDEGTCEWFKHHTKFQEWQQSKKASLLWVSADPGCGKSVLSKYLVDDVLPTTDKHLTCYFFFKDDLDDQKTLLSSLRCLLHQVFEQNLSLLDVNLLSKFEKDGQLLNSRTDLWKILIDIFQKQLVECFVCILDGFDECAADDRSFLMENLEKLYMEKTVPPLKLLLTSRPYEDISRGLRKLQKRELIIHLSGESEQEMDKISREIDIVIQNNVDDLGEDLDLEPDVTDLIKNELTKVENRTYLWVSLMIDILKNTIETSKSALKTVIQQLPRTVSAAYEKILSREQNDETNAKTRRLLHIILAATEPLLTEELAVAFSMSGDASVDEKAISRNTKFTREFSKLLVVFRGGKAYLAHQTVKEFLVMESPRPPENALLGPVVRWEHSFHPHHSHFVMAKSCMSYLERYGSNYGVLFYYAARNWPGHFRGAGHVNEILVTQSRNLCNSSSKQVQPWFETYWQMAMDTYYYPRNPTSLIVASILGLKETVEMLLNVTNTDLYATDSTYHKTAFFWACDRGYLSIGKSLLDWVSKSNADISYRIINTFDRDANTPLHRVIEKLSSFWGTPLDSASDPQYDILGFLLNRGANINASNFQANTPLHLARRCSGTIVKLLLQSGANMRLKNKEGYTALHRAAECGNLAVVKVLLKHAAKSNIDNCIHSQGFYIKILLLTAIESHDRGLVELLLDPITNVKLEYMLSNDGQFPSCIGTLLTFTIKQQASEITEFLLKRGADANFTSPNKLTLLLEAVANGGCETVKILLDHGADVNLTPPNRLTPLLHAITDGDCEMVKILLDHGVDVNLAPPNQLTPLLQAIISKNRDMVELLINYGADANTCTNDHESPLFFALIWGVNRNIITLLLNHGADVNFVSRNGRTSLSVMADIDDQCVLVDTPITTAIKCGRADIVQDLVSRGADPDPAFRYLSRSWIHETDRQNALLWRQELQTLLLAERAGEDRDLGTWSLIDRGLEVDTRIERDSSRLDQEDRKHFFNVVL